MGIPSARIVGAARVSSCSSVSGVAHRSQDHAIQLICTIEPTAVRSRAGESSGTTTR
jgi:hypothetical protein